MLPTWRDLEPWGNKSMLGSHLMWRGVRGSRFRVRASPLNNQLKKKVTTVPTVE